MLPISKGGYKPQREWLLLQEDREKALAKRHQASEEAWSTATHKLVPLGVGTVVSVQNQRGRNKNKWDNSGVVVECLPFSQYKVKLDGTGRVTLRNRVALRRIVPYGVSVPDEGRLKLERSSGTGMQKGPPGTLHPKASSKPNNGEVVGGSSPRVSLVGQEDPVVQDIPDISEDLRGLVVPETTCSMPHVILQGLPNEIEVSEQPIEPESANVVLRRSSQVRKKPDRMNL